MSSKPIKIPTIKELDRMRNDLKYGRQTVRSVGKELSLTEKQIRFVEVYMSGETDWVAKSAAKIAYPECTDESAAQFAHQNMRNARIKLLMDMIYVNENLTKTQLDKQLVRNIKTGDTQALKLAYEVTGLLKQTLDITVRSGIDYGKYTDEQLIQLKRLLEIGRRPDNDGIDGGDMQTESV
jgi:hypothetical protein